MSGLVNKVKEALHPDKTHTHEQPEGTHGPHGKVGNTVDPRVDSDRDHRANPATGHHDVGAMGGGLPSGNATTGYDDPVGVHGPHGSRAANAADPRVDSDRDHRGAPGSGLTGSHGTHGTTGAGVGGLGSGNNTTGYDDPAGTHGHHNNRAANLVDPRIDSDRDHRGAAGAAGTSHIGSGPGPAANTAGPHKQDILNKADPRVDSDLDGSKTVGGNKTYTQ